MSDLLKGKIVQDSDKKSGIVLVSKTILKRQKFIGQV